MTQINKLRIGLALNAIAMLSDEFTFDRIKDKLKEIEQIVADEPDTDDPEGKTAHTCHTCKHYTSGEYAGSCGSYICKGYSNYEYTFSDYPDLPYQFDNMTGSMNL